MSSIPEVPGYAQVPSNNSERCPVSGLKRGTFLKYFPIWREHPVKKLRVLRLTEGPTAKRGITLYHKGDLQELLDYEAEQQQEAKAS